LILVTTLLGLLISSPLSAAERGTILLYAAPNNGKLVEKLPGNTALIPIYQQKKWLKVGDPRNGKVGWVNRQQWQAARNAFYRPDIQTVYIHSDHNKKGKPEFNIVAYKNGKKLSPELAKRLYRKIRQQQIQQARSMRRSFNWIDQPFFEAGRFPFEPSLVVPSKLKSSHKVRQTLEG
jgi:hypothetical protein